MTKERRTRWLDIDTAPRDLLALSFAQERQRIARQLYQITIDMEHWNNNHPNEKPLAIVLDFTLDVIELDAGNSE